MSVLDIFYFLFKLDPSDLKKGTDEAVNNTRNAAKKIDNDLQKVGVDFARNLIKSVSGLAASVLSIQAVMSGLAHAVDYDIQLGRTSRALGVDAGQLDIWSRAVQQAGGSSEDFQASLRGVAEHFHTTAQVALKAFPQIGDVLSHLSRYGAFTYGKAIGLNEPTILLLQKHKKELNDILEKQRQLGIITKQDIEVSTKYKNELDNLNTSFRFLYNALAIDALPVLSDFFKTLEKGLSYLTIHKDLVVGAFIAMAAGALGFAFSFGLITIEGIVLTAVILLLIGLFALLYDDIRGYMKGSKSATGELIKEMDKLADTVNKMLDKWIEKTLDFLDKFKLLKPIIDYLRSDENSDSFYKQGHSQSQGHFRGKNLLAFASSTPLNNATSNSHFYESAFNKNFVINSMPIEINTQATDAVGIATHLSLTINDQLQQASNIFATSTYV